MRNTDSVGLLDLLQERTGCIYISDLHDARYAKSILQVVRGIDADGYTSKMWSDAVNYIIGTSESFETTDAAIAFLCTHLEDAAR